MYHQQNYKQLDNNNGNSKPRTPKFICFSFLIDKDILNNLQQQF